MAFCWETFKEPYNCVLSYWPAPRIDLPSEYLKPLKYNILEALYSS